MNKKILFILILLTVGGAILRLWQVDHLPAILNRDEAALAYNGWLLNRTGQDEFQRHWPLTFESFGDYKLPGYPYSLALLFSFLPTSDWVVRLPSVLAGVLLIPLSFWLARQLKLSDKEALFLSTLASITPIFMFYSRIAFEANVALTLMVLFLGLLFKKASPVITILSIIAAIAFYNTPLLLLPFVVLGLPLLFGLKNFKKWLPRALTLGVVFIISFAALSSISAQKSGITIFSDQTVWQNFIEYRTHLSGWEQSLLGNKYFYYAQLIVKNLGASLSPTFLVTHGGSHPWHNLPHWGHLLWSIYVLGILGLVSNLISIIKNFSLKKLLTKPQPQLFLLYLTLTSLAPAVITVDAPHATRSLLFIYLWLIWAVYGVKFLFKILDSVAKLPNTLKWGVLILILGIEVVNYQLQYFHDFPQEQPESLKPGFEEIINQVETQFPDQEIAVVDGGGYQYILTAWYLKVPPQEFFDTIIKQLPNRIGFKYGQQVTHYHFIADPKDRSPQESVLVEWNDQGWQIQKY